MSAADKGGPDGVPTLGAKVDVGGAPETSTLGISASLDPVVKLSVEGVPESSTLDLNTLPGFSA